MGLVSKQRPRGRRRQGREFLITGFGDLDGGGRDEVEIDLADWGEPARAALDERLHLLQAPHRWNGSWLVVAEADVAWIEGIIEQVEDERHVASSTPTSTRSPTTSPAGTTRTAGASSTASTTRPIAYGLDDDELVVHEIDEQRVDELVDAILEPDAPPPAGRRGPHGGDGRAVRGRRPPRARSADDGEGRRPIADGAAEAAHPRAALRHGQGVVDGHRRAAAATLVRTARRRRPPDEERVGRAGRHCLRDHLRPYV